MRVYRILRVPESSYREANLTGIYPAYLRKYKYKAYRILFFRGEEYINLGIYKDLKTALMVRDCYFMLTEDKYTKNAIRPYYDPITLQKNANIRGKTDILGLIQYLTGKFDLSNPKRKSKIYFK